MTQVSLGSNIAIAGDFDLTNFQAIDFSTGGFTFDIADNSIYLTASQADGARIVSSEGGEINIYGYDGTSVDFSGISTDGLAYLHLNEDITLSDEFEAPNLELVVGEDATLAFTSAQGADGLRVSGEGSVEIHDFDPQNVNNFSGFQNAGSKVLNLGSSGTLNAETDLGKFALEVPNGETLALKAADADGLVIGGAGNINLSGFSGAAVDLSGIEVAGSKTATISSTTDLTSTNLTGFTVVGKRANAIIRCYISSVCIGNRRRRFSTASKPNNKSI